MWMLLVLLYGVLKGVREVVKKKALTKNTVMEVLFFYTLLAFLFAPTADNKAVTQVPIFCPMIIGNAVANVTEPVAQRA